MCSLKSPAWPETKSARQTLAQSVPHTELIETHLSRTTKSSRFQEKIMALDYFLELGKVCKTSARLDWRSV
jgi:hypothetical protein